MESVFATLAHFSISVGPALLMFAAFALVFGGLRLIRTGGDRKKGVLMLVCAAVFVANVMIWTL
ncbi:hypothetical protein [Sphingomonas cavernae]|uniref:Uncharacterized protein n=1 Tax=Sphingomonas cavernae TaxID=2320861 RepID=A0A418W667_9SPHN|nr:hypothetical protein [Sphingomonas cavernae]RJF85502.1 hypothetical protein D3876_16340 [Sphingomonas cavernae]